MVGLWLLLVAWGMPCYGFVVVVPNHHRSFATRSVSESFGDFDRVIGDWSDPLFESNSVCSDYRLLQERVDWMKRHQHTKEQQQQQPEPLLEKCPQKYVHRVLDALWNVHVPHRNAGTLLLLGSSTPEWKKQIHGSVGAPFDAPAFRVAHALTCALLRPQNQYALLVQQQLSTKPLVEFPSDFVDMDDGAAAWVECRLRHATTNQLLVITGWSLVRTNTSRGRWHWSMDGMEWQDFRDEFRPGIGREEWMRICG